MLTEKQIELIKSSVPFLQEHGVEITSLMYSQMLANNPEFRQIFNQGHQRTGRQQISLAAAVLAYAQNYTHANHSNIKQYNLVYLF